jgi:hypothetical protein
MVTWLGWMTAGCRSVEEGMLTGEGLGDEGRESLAGKWGTVDPAKGNTLPIKRQNRGKNTRRKAVVCIVKVSDSGFVKRRRSVFLFELFSVAIIG